MAKTKPSILSYRTIIQKDGKYYHGWVPALPGCHTQGDTVEETKVHLREAIELYLESLIAHGDKIPSNKENVYEGLETFDLSSFPAYA